MRTAAGRAMAEFGPLFDEMNFSEALKSLWVLVAETDGYLTANAPWKKPAERTEADHAALQARVLATAAESIRVITALVYPILPTAASKVWRQLGLGEIQDAAGQGFLTNLAWGGLRAGTKFGEPAPLFPRAEKDAVERMQNLEDENNASAVEAAAGQGNAQPHAPSATSVSPTEAPRGAEQDEELTKSTIAPHPHDTSRAVDIAKVHEVPKDIAPAREKTEPSTTDVGEKQANPNPAPQPGTTGQPTATSTVESGPQNVPGQTAAEPTHITIDDFAKVELRVAQVLVAERIPKADKLLRLEVDLGYEKRQILAGIAQYYEPEKLVGRKIVIVANLAPRKMRGLESNGMLLAASLPPDGAPVLAGFLEDVPLGARLK